MNGRNLEVPSCWKTRLLENNLADDLTHCSECGLEPPVRLVKYMLLCGYLPCMYKRKPVCGLCIRDHYAMHEIAGELYARSSPYSSSWCRNDELKIARKKWPVKTILDKERKLLNQDLLFVERAGISSRGA